MSKAELKRRCSSILNNRDMYQPLNENDTKFLLKIFEKHHHWEEKKGLGVNFITIEPDVSRPYKKCFYLNRIDGSKIDIGFNEAINPKAQKQKIAAACRDVIKDEIEAVKQSVRYGVDRCPITGEILTKTNTDIDHYNLKFNELFNLWLKDKNINELEKALINNTEEIITTIYFTDENVKKDFREFHNNNTHLRAISQTANRSILRQNNNLQDDEVTLDDLLKKIKF